MKLKGLRGRKKVGLFRSMPEISNEQVAKLASLVQSLQAFLETVRQPILEIPAEIAKRVLVLSELGICLRCELKKPGRYTRGCCVNCYNTSIKEIAGDPTVERKLILAGRLKAETQKGGRKPTTPALEDVLAKPPAMPVGSQAIAAAEQMRDQQPEPPEEPHPPRTPKKKKKPL